MERKDHHQDANDDEDSELLNLWEELTRCMNDVCDVTQKLNEIEMKGKKKDGIEVADEKHKDELRKKLRERKMGYEKVNQRMNAVLDLKSKESEEKSQESEPEQDKDKKSRERKMESKKSGERMKAILDVDSKQSKEKGQEPEPEHDKDKKSRERKMESKKSEERVKAILDVDSNESEEKSREPEPEQDQDKKSRERKTESKKSEERMKAILDVDSKESEQKSQEYSESAYEKNFPVLNLKMGHGSDEKRSKEEKGYYQVQIHFDESLGKQVKQFSKVLIDPKYIPHVGLVRGLSLDIKKLRLPLNRFAFVWTKKIPLSFNAIGWPKPQPNDITVYLNAIPDPVLYDLQAELIRLIEKTKCVLDVDYHGDKWFPECPIAARLSNDEVLRVYEAVAPKLPLIGHATELAVVKYTESEDGGQRRLTCEKLYSTAFIGIPSSKVSLTLS